VDVMEESFAQIDWDDIDGVMRQVVRPRRVFIMKHIASICGVVEIEGE